MPDPDLAALLERLEALHQKATPGEWYFTESVGDALEDLVVNQEDEDVPVLSSEFIGCEECNANWDSVAALHNSFPAILATCRELMAKVERYERSLNDIIAEYEPYECPESKNSLSDDMARIAREALKGVPPT